MSTLPRYLVKIDEVGRRKCYRYMPPASAVAAGVVKRVVMDDLDVAVAYANEQNVLLDEWNNSRKVLRKLAHKANMQALLTDYLTSDAYMSLRAKTKEDYAYALKVWQGSRIGGVPLLKAVLANITTPDAQRLYDQHHDRPSLANHSLAVYRLLFNYAIRKGYCTFNPFSLVKRKAEKKRRVIWQRENVRAFLNTAFSRWEWRSTGVIVYCAWEWAQRLGDMRCLRWEQYNAETGVLSLTQSKRGSSVVLPTSDGLRKVLQQQQDDFGWQQYIAPSRHRDGKQGLMPMSLDMLHQTGSRIMKAAGLPDELRMADLRRTAITEMVEVGVPLPSIMAVSGHATPMSLTPYIRNTLRGSTTAQNMRQLPETML